MDPTFSDRMQAAMADYEEAVAQDGFNNAFSIRELAKKHNIGKTALNK